MAKFALKKVTPQRIRKQQVPVELMGQFFLKMAEQHGDELGRADPEFASFAAYAAHTGRVPGKKAAPFDLEDHLTMIAVTKRAFALVKLSETGVLANWEQKKSDHVMLHPALISACATTKLRGDGEAFEFNEKEFLDAALAAAAVNEPFPRS